MTSLDDCNRNKPSEISTSINSISSWEIKLLKRIPSPIYVMQAINPEPLDLYLV